MARCNRVPCPGSIDGDGLCDVCLEPPLPDGAPGTTVAQGVSVPLPGRRTPPGSSGAVAGTVRTGAGKSGSGRRTAARTSESASRAAAAAVAGNPFWGTWLVDPPRVQPVEPADKVQSDPRVEEDHRSCRKCRKEVGRSHDGQPALDEGFCDTCGTPFSFLPKLCAGETVDGRYEVAGCIGFGGVGWVYLAHDVRLERRPVVLKGLRDAEDRAMVESAIREKHFLTGVGHENIVRIHDFATRPPAAGGAEPEGYIVMEFVPGYTWQEHPPATLEHLLRSTLDVLGAFDYLHRREILFCDFKPDNVMYAGARIKLIDLGAARTTDDVVSRVWYSYDFAAPEIKKGAMPTVASDLYAVGAVLEKLGTERLGSPERGAASLSALIERATAPLPQNRFASAAEMAGQVSGVLREMLATGPGAPDQLPSLLFAPSPVLLDGGLGAVPPVDRWLTQEAHRSAAVGRWAPLADGRPDAVLVAAGLPYPAGSALDPAAGFVATVSPDPGEAAAQLEAYSGFSPDVGLLRCRALLARGKAAVARTVLDRVRAEAPRDWRVGWYDALADAVDGDFRRAAARFQAVRAALPGEPAPQLALAVCAEHLGDRGKAEFYYGAVWSTDRGHEAAAFGLARIRLGRGDRAEAISVLDEIPKTSLHAAAARTAAVRVHAGRLASERADADPAGIPPGYPDLAAAVSRLDGAGIGEAALDRLRLSVQEALLDWVVREGAAGEPEEVGTDAEALFGCRPTERALRTLVEGSVRDLAQRQADRGDGTVLIDLANTVRPHTRWSW